MSSGLSRYSSHTNLNDTERRQSRRLRQRERRQLMSQEQRETTLSRRRSNYLPRRHRIAETYHNESNMNMTAVATGTNPTIVQQTCRLDPIPNFVLPCAFELGSTSNNQNIAHGSTTAHNEDGIRAEVALRHQQNELCLNAQLHMPTRMQVIGLGWKITVGISVYDFGRLILRIIRKLKRHTAKRIALIEGWDLTEKGISARRQLDENTLFRKKIRPANDDDIKVFYSQYKSR